jgi:energy-coupling factor transporter ATP-binding protein EcfA2
MKITETSQLCPYTGLRSFTEEESLYFKGRDEQVDQVTTQLQERKFLMLTGASGEGKSSLIYAGLIPNARAGFFKARYANWVVVDFRPERSPIKSMARALADKFLIQPDTIETEMRRGFSSLADLYLNSDFYVDENDEAWKGLPDTEKKLRTRSASNLLIIVDQFEEFFTNPENYYNESPSEESQIVVNLILETARIALQQNLPIYVVCTMRSDYIGQCSSFRGLPEHIGYSQFFVPRLKRKELKQVIEEPALLSGNRITQRLTERLVYDLAEGVDQLPILQHALSQIWLMANRGEEEMDLVHYAMVGGMPSAELPPGDLLRFEEWFKGLPDYQQKFYSETGLNKVIENHASRLYESAAEYYNGEHPATPITTKDAKNIVALTFSCLTKIDNSRAVRNRMTLREITAIVNRPHLTAEIVGSVLNIFREEGNSFVRPFKTEDKATHELAADSVLDITHESLIRNWGMLHKWASQEFEYYSTFLDLKKQLDRWKEHRKSSGYLLPIGPLSYFENWYAKCSPNTAWINRYAERKEDSSATWKESENLLLDIREFLKRSASHVLISRAFLKYGAQKIGVVTAIALLLILCGFYWFDAEQKKNERVLENVRAEARALLSGREISNQAKATYLLTEERFSAGFAVPYLESINDPNDRIGLSIATYQQLIFIDKNFKGQTKFNLISNIQRDFNSALSRSNDFEATLTHFNQFILLLAYDNYYNPNDGLVKTLKETTAVLYDLLLVFYKNRQLYKINVAINLNQAIQYWLAFGNPSQDKISVLLAMISPLSNEQASATFDVFYPRGSFEPNGFRALDFNAGYHTLASLYAASGEIEKVEWCFNQLLTQPDYFTDKVFNNYLNVIGYLYQFGHRKLVPQAVAGISSHFPVNTPQMIYRDLIIRSGYLSPKFRVNFQISYAQIENGNFHLNLCLASRDEFNAITEDYERSLSAVQDASERNFLYAMHFKRRALYEHKYSFDRGLLISHDYLDSLFDKAWSYFLQIKDTDLEKRVTINTSFVNISTNEYSRRQLFLYPDYMGGWLSLTYHSDRFLQYMDKRDLFNKSFKTSGDLDMLHSWVSNMFELKIIGHAEALTRDFPVSDSTLERLLDIVAQHPAGKDFDRNLILLVLANRSFQQGDTLRGANYYNKMKQQDIVQSSNRYEIWKKNFFANQLMELSKNLLLAGKVKEAVLLTEKLQGNAARILSYNYGANKAYDNDYSPVTFTLLDSTLSKMRLDDPSRLPGYLEYRGKVIYVLDKIGGEKMIDVRNKILRTIPEGRKFQATRATVKGIAERGDFYAARMFIPGTLTEEQDLVCRSIILLQAAQEREKANNSPAWKAMDAYYAWDEYVLFFGFIS